MNSPSQCSNGAAHGEDNFLLHNLLQNIPDTIYFKDRESRFILINPALARLFGMKSVEEAIGKTDFDIFTYEHASNAMRDEQEILHTGNPMVDKEEKETWPDGTVTWVTTTKLPLRNAKGDIVGTFGMSRNVTARKMAEDTLKEVVKDLQASQDALQRTHQQLVQAEKMETVGRMASGIAHEVQNPLQILLISIDYLVQRLPNRDAEMEGVLGEMRLAAERANTIIRGLLDFSRSDELTLQSQDLNALVHNTLNLVRHHLAANQVSTVENLEPDLPCLPLDCMKIEQVLVNLFNNAIHAMPAGGTLTVTTRCQQLTEGQRNLGAREAAPFYAGDRVVIVEIEDTGPGIPLDLLRKIFDPFFTTKVTGQGTGLGLAITKSIIELHHGEIQINNRPEGGVQCQIMFKIPKETLS
jgi:PAS domain S-box-containing protein